MDNETMVKTIRELCFKNNISISQLENDLNFGAGLVSRWTKSSPSIDKIVDIADYFHVSLDDVVGYKYNIEEDFLKSLLDQTQSKNIQWHSQAILKNDELLTYDLVGTKCYNVYDASIYEDSTYYTNFNDGYIQIYSVYKKGEIINPVLLYLTIQPKNSNPSDLRAEECNINILKILYLHVLKSLNHEAPHEIKVEELKNTFIYHHQNKTIKQQRKAKGVASDSATLMKLLEIYNAEEFQKLKQTFSDPEFQAAIQAANKMQEYFNNLNQ